MLPAAGLVLAVAVMLQVLVVAAPMALQVIVDRIAPLGRTDWLIGMGFALLLAIIAESSLALTRERILFAVQAWIDRQLMARFVTHLISLPLRFFQQRQTGDLAQRVAGIGAVREFVVGEAVPSLMNTLSLLAVFACMFAYNPALGGIVALAGVAKVALAAGFAQRRRDLVLGHLTAGSKEIGILTECFYGIETLKAARDENATLERWFGKLATRVEFGLRKRRFDDTTGALATGIQGAALGATVWFGGRAVIASEMTLGALTAFLALQAMALSLTDALTGGLTLWREFSGTLERLEEAWRESPRPDGQVEAPRIKGLIEVEDVSFHYAGDSAPTLSRISMVVHPGERIALVGDSGSGKSTLASLLVGLLTPDAGRILFDGVDLQDYRLESLLGHIGIVPQDAFLFDDTVYANVAFGHSEATPARIREAVASACLEADLDLMPDGLYSRVGDGGCRLSGGQRQRVCIARALVRNPAILLLDEATSALDLETERQIHANLGRLGCTRIVIAHRVETVLDADRVLVMRHGQIIQAASPSILAKEPGHLADMMKGAGL
jgi:ABC-type bacteriocin/lantibiotic exporter with double-glycine peptidase domain